MAAATLPTPPIGDPGSLTSITANPYVVLNRMSYAQWRELISTMDERQTAITVTSNFAGDANAIISATAHGLAIGDRVAFTGTTIPTGLSATERYYVKAVNSTTSFEVALTSATGTVIAMADADFVAGTFYPSCFADMPVDWAALVTENAGFADKWSREMSWAYHNPGATPAELWRAGNENAGKLGWDFGNLNTSTLLSPYVQNSRVNGQSVATDLMRGFADLPGVEQARLECIISTATANQSRLGEVSRRFGVTNGASADGPDYNTIAVPANTAFDSINFVTTV